MLKAALGYANKLQWPVFPLRAGGKEPNGRLVPNGVYDATLSNDVIQSWWKSSPRANIGLPCGNGFFVLDVDPRNDGDETLGKLEHEHGLLPQTPRAITGSGGAHILFKLKEGQRLRGSLGAGIDVKGIGGYIVASPSIHPSGGEYVWEASAHPLEIPIADPPEWMSEMLIRRAASVGVSVGPAADSFIARCFDVAGWLGDSVDPGRVIARCPWSYEHSVDAQGNRTGDGYDSSCVIMAPTAERPLGIFHCAHGHCSSRGNVEALRALPIAAVRIVASYMPTEFEHAIHLVSRMVAK